MSKYHQPLSIKILDMNVRSHQVANNIQCPSIAHLCQMPESANKYSSPRFTEEMVAYLRLTEAEVREVKQDAQVCFGPKPPRENIHMLSPLCKPRFETEIFCDMDSCLSIDVKQLGKKKLRSINTNQLNTQDILSKKDDITLKLAGIKMQPENSLGALPENNKRLFYDYSVHLSERTNTSTRRRGTDPADIQARDTGNKSVPERCRMSKSKMQLAP